MLRASLLLALLGLCSLAAAQQTYSSVQPSNYTLTLSFTLDGVTTTPAPCTQFDPSTSTCLPQGSVPDGDSITIAYSGPATPGNTVSLMFCYSNTSSVNRAWRKYNAVISEDKKCNVAKPFKTGLPTGEGSFKWTPGPNSAPSTYQIQLLEVVAGSDPTTYAASGKSEGYYQIIPIDSRPTWLMALVGVFCTVGPITLAGFFTYEKIYKKD
ncbi:hypothetical protein CHLNCDRAFT_138676 [Chlorella variabilis]|uniref:High-affinity nitrate transporter n=1 Tax=Chlorella variabilis TaxID=554065 RepID=E1ZNI7_CHLVA|nr:hypothetical protein CHLNCDRAFT_138676 [Chlorella variabilis]EFN52612.1 hypothetical protein CHLNCDRAFT_138676 [Chlorella variabilis]|eukprot:XP_005844714.1 hypothetical protein CHLNCDRAFT_138676 [Chlorella variabilis]